MESKPKATTTTKPMATTTTTKPKVTNNTTKPKATTTTTKPKAAPTLAKPKIPSTNLKNNTAKPKAVVTKPKATSNVKKVPPVTKYAAPEKETKKEPEAPKKEEAKFELIHDSFTSLVKNFERCRHENKNCMIVDKQGSVGTFCQYKTKAQDMKKTQLALK